MLTISMKHTQGKQNLDLMVNEEQKICDTIAVLEETGVLNHDSGILTIYSERNGKRIDPACTYRESDLYNGDILNIGYTRE